ncbi:gametocyte-specific factor 1 [Melanerpes formicivorus]|uniref:gametocyte-specific factor 1 n=1 Tax=Melanerpes formicivorus TaxID=211600 RepID=UPI00358FEBF3
MELQEGFDAQDPERLLQCPYNKQHQIRACRFPYHLVKCRKSHPELAKQLATCPFSARHLVPQPDLRDHILSCPDRGLLEQDMVHQSCGSQRMAVSTWQAPPCEEDWEAELQEEPEPLFIWGETKAGISRATSAEQSQLPSRLRAPRSSPWKS